MPIDLPIIKPAIVAEQEDDGLQYMSMPDSMTTYQAPELPDDEVLAQSHKAMALLGDIRDALETLVIGERKSFSLESLETAELQIINQVLGEGDVSIIIDGPAQVCIQESIFTGVWRVQAYDDKQNLIEDYIELAQIPAAVFEQTFAGSQQQLYFDSQHLPAGVMNAPPLLAEISEYIDKPLADDFSHSINLSLLPQTEEDLAFLQTQLGPGRTRVLSRGYGNCRIVSSGTQHTWWVQYFNSQDQLILNTIEICKVPQVACAGEDDWRDSAQRLQDILGVISA